MGETHVLRADVGNHVAIARRHGDTLYLGAMSDEEARTLEVSLSFLDDGQLYRLTSWGDGSNAHRHAEHFQTRTRTVQARETLPIEIAPGGGYAGAIQTTETGANP